MRTDPRCEARRDRLRTTGFWMFFGLALSLAAAPLACAQDQDRSPSERQAVVDLAYVLGQSHALRQVCEGATDQFWRGRMVRLIQTEQPDVELDRRMKEAFNAGYAAAQAAYPSCSPQSRRAEAVAAGRGRVLVQTLSEP